VTEALALGRPVLGYDHGGAGEQLQRFLPAGCVPPGATGAAVERLTGWWSAPPAVVPDGVFTLQEMCSRTLRVYRELAAQGA
jgi:glycosyltransferase involved in cell wall biosynthesis